MPTTKKAIAGELGVTKRTVANYIERLGLDEHITRVGQTDMVDDFAAAALADEIRKNIPERERRDDDSVGLSASDTLVDVLNQRIADLSAERDRLVAQIGQRDAELAELRAAREREAERHEGQLERTRERYQRQVDAANGRADRLAMRLADIMDVMTRLAAAHWWERGRIIRELPAPGNREYD